MFNRAESRADSAETVPRSARFRRRLRHGLLPRSHTKVSQKARSNRPMRSTPAGSCSTSAHRMLGFQRSVQRLPSSKRQERKEASPAGAFAQWAKGHMTARQKVRMTENWSPTIPGPQRTRPRTSVPHARCIPGRRPCRLRQPWRRGGAVNARALPSHSTRRARRATYLCPHSQPRAAWSPPPARLLAAPRPGFKATCIACYARVRSGPKHARRASWPASTIMYRA